MARKNNENINETSKQIAEKKQDIKYSTRDYVVEYLVQKFQADEFYIPSEEYQRQFIWSNNDRCTFIESLLMGLPIPFSAIIRIRKKLGMQFLDRHQWHKISDTNSYRILLI